MCTEIEIHDFERASGPVGNRRHFQRTWTVQGPVGNQTRDFQ